MVCRLLLGRNILLTHGLAMRCVLVCHDVDRIIAVLYQGYLGPEHLEIPAGTGNPSYCMLQMFHPPKNPNEAVNGLGYISNDGHLFECNKPVMQRAFHV